MIQTVPACVAGAEGPSPLTLHRVTDVGYRQILLAVLRDLAMDDGRHPRFPGPNPVSLDSSHLPKLRAEPYYVCEKTDGVRHLLLCCTLETPFRKLNVCVLVDRALAMYLLPVQHLPRAAYQGTLLDGELAWNKRRARWEYLVFDAVAVSGIPVLNGTLPERMDAVHRMVRVYAAHDASGDVVDLRPKTFVACCNLREFEDSLPSLEQQYDIDGVILTPATAPVTYGRHYGMFKLKFDARHTVDFLVGPDGRQLGVFDNGAHVTVGSLAPGHSAPPGSIAECATAGQQGVWTLVTLRTDKATANDMFTYQKTLLNMRENLGLADLKQVFCK